MNDTTSGTELVKPRPARKARAYDPAFRHSAVEHYHRSGATIARTAQDLGINHWTLREWIQAEAARQAPAPPARTLNEAEREIARLRAEVARLTEQRDILKKSLGILSHT